MKNSWTIFFLLICGLSFGQKEASIWYFGSYAGLDFNCNPPTSIRSGMYYSQEGCASISDTLGNLRFYTNGDSVFNRKHNVMPNGFGIGNDPSCWGSSTQGALIIPRPASDSLYYIFTVDCADDNMNLPNAFRYSIIDMSIDGGLGDVITKHQHLKTPVTEKLAAIHHANGRDIWVVMHEHGTDAFFSYLVSPNGLDTVPVISHAGQIQWLPTYSEAMTRGYMKFSPNGENIIVLSVSDQHSYCLYPELFHFNDATGQITLNYTIIDSDSINYYGATFSPDNNLLYLSGGWYGQYVHQFNANAVSSSSFLASKQVVFTTTNHYPSALQIGPDGKIYVATLRSWIDVIQNPNIYGAGCNYQSEAIRLHDCPSQTYSFSGLPNFPESYFRSTFIGDNCIDTIVAQFSYTDSCEGSATYFTDNTLIFPDIVNNWEWNFDDPTSGINNTSNLRDPLHTFTSSGTYSIKLIVATDLDSICKTDTITKTIYIDVCVTGVNETILEKEDVKIYPNPFSNQVSVVFINNERSTLSLYNFIGQQILQQTFVNSTTLNTQQLADGIYFYELHNEKGLISNGKIIRQ